jgi:hypothetical protein
MVLRTAAKVPFLLTLEQSPDAACTMKLNSGEPNARHAAFDDWHQ